MNKTIKKMIVIFMLAMMLIVGATIIHANCWHCDQDRGMNQPQCAVHQSGYLWCTHNGGYCEAFGPVCNPNPT